MEKLHGHPNIITIIDIASKEQCEREGLPPYFIMDYVDGASLEQKMHSDEGFTLDFIIKVATDTLSALGHCHKQGIIHRDIKPSNILLTRDQQVILTDFGIAKAKMNTSKTGEGIALGSTDYMSPEQALGKRDLDHRSDIYSFGITLYEMVVGKLPFIGDNPNQVAIMHIQDEPKAPMAINPEIPAKLNTIIMRAIAKKPDDRYQTCADFIAALNNLQEAPNEPEKVEISAHTIKIAVQGASLPEDSLRSDDATEAQAHNDSPAHLSRISGSSAPAVIRNVLVMIALIGALVGMFLGGAALYRKLTVGAVMIESGTPQASASFDGKAIGAVPCKVEELSPGWHKVALEAAGYHTRTEMVEIKAGETLLFKRELRKNQPDAEPKVKAAINNWLDVAESDRTKTRSVRLSQAISAIEKILAEFPYEEKAHQAYFEFCEANKLLPLAENFYYAQRNKAPTRLLARAMLGLTYLRQGKLKQASEELNYAYNHIDRYNITVLNALGEYYDREGKNSIAKGYYETSLYLKPDQPAVKERLAN